jgi:hypothetical protein
MSRVCLQVLTDMFKIYYSKESPAFFFNSMMAFVRPGKDDGFPKLHLKISRKEDGKHGRCFSSLLVVKLLEL